MSPGLHLKPLEPELISGLLGRWRPEENPEAPLLRRFKPRTRCLLIAMAVTVIILCVAYLDHGLTTPAGVRTAIGLIIKPASSPVHISLALLQDPVGLITIAVILFTPVLLAEQGSATGRLQVS